MQKVRERDGVATPGTHMTPMSEMGIRFFFFFKVRIERQLLCVLYIPYRRRGGGGGVAQNQGVNTRYPSTLKIRFGTTTHKCLLDNASVAITYVC